MLPFDDNQSISQMMSGLIWIISPITNQHFLNSTLNEYRVNEWSGNVSYNQNQRKIAWLKIPKLTFFMKY